MGLASDLVQRISVGGRRVADTLTQGVGSASEFVRKNPVTSSVSVAGGVLAGVTAVQIVRKARKKSTKAKAKPKKSTKKSQSKRKKYGGHTKRGWKLDRAKRSKEKHEVAYQRRKRKAGKTKHKKKPGVYKTKTGQPYRIMANGKARFIKKGGRK